MEETPMNEKWLINRVCVTQDVAIECQKPEEKLKVVGWFLERRIGVGPATRDDYMRGFSNMKWPFLIFAPGAKQIQGYSTPPSNRTLHVLTYHAISHIIDVPLDFGEFEAESDGLEALINSL